MNEKTIDLYDVFSIARPTGASALLTICQYITPKKLGWRRRPAVLILPGGAYSFTSERESEPVALRFAAMGYIPCVLHYSCAPLCYPVPLREAAMAMRYIRENADALAVDPEMVAALGFSAGGHLCGMLGTLYDSRDVADIGSQRLLRPDALALCYPVAVSSGRTHEESFYNISGGNSELREKLSLDKLVRPDMPPVFMWHTRNDESVPCHGTLILAEALEEAGVDFALHIYKSGHHGLSTADVCANRSDSLTGLSWDVASWLDAAIRFFEECGFHIRDAGTV